MPRIPMSEKAGLIRHVSDSVHMQGAPGLNWKLDEGQALINMGEKLGRGAERLGLAGIEFGRRLQETEDKLNATKIESLWREGQSALEARMKDSPGAYDKFGEWARETDRNFTEASKPYMEKMSSRSRELLEARMEGYRAEAIHRRTAIGNHARATADYNFFQEEWKEAALRGDRDGCVAMLNAYRGDLISEQEYERKMGELDGLLQGGEAKRRILAGDWEIASELRETDSEGRYKFYPAMDEGYRMKLLKYADMEEAKMIASAQEELVERMQSGETITEADIERNFEGQDTAGAQKMKKAQLAVVRKFNDQQAAARRQAEREARQEERAARQEEREAQREAEAKRKKQVDEFEYRLITHTFPNSATDRAKEYAELKTQIFETFAGDGPVVYRLLGHLNESFKAAEKPDTSYKNGYLYKYAMAYMKLKVPPSNFRSYERAGDFTRTKDAARELTSHEMMLLKVDEFVRENPNAKPEDVVSFIDQTAKFICEQQFSDLMSAWRDVTIPHTDTRTIMGVSQDLRPGEVERVVNGRIAIFGSDHTFIRWKE